jgi:hypothetical protein
MLLLSMLGAACTGGDDDATPTDPATPTTSTDPTDAGGTTFTPGAFRYQNAGLVVDLQLEANAGTMDVNNGSGFALGKPDVYVLDGLTGARIEGRVLDAQPIDDGAQATFQVQFPPEVTPKSLGLVILLFGSDNYGAFAPA